MATDLQKMYLRARMTGDRKLGHRAALRKMATDTGLDEGSVSRALARAQREDDRASKKRARA